MVQCNELIFKVWTSLLLRPSNTRNNILHFQCLRQYKFDISSYLYIVLCCGDCSSHSCVMFGSWYCQERFGTDRGIGIQRLEVLWFVQVSYRDILLLTHPWTKHRTHFLYILKSISAAWSCALSRLQHLHWRLWSPLPMDGHVHRCKEFQIIHGVQSYMVALFTVCTRMGYGVWSFEYLNELSKNVIDPKSSLLAVNTFSYCYHSVVESPSSI